MKPFSLLIKPTSADCNMNCDYCFYLDKRKLYPQSRAHRMPETVLEQLVKTYLKTDQPNYTFGWQGGEPLLMGVEFFKQVAGFQNKYARPGSLVSNGLQTNATLIDNTLAEFLASYCYLVGCSLDGPPELHNRFRKFSGGKGSHSIVLNGIRRLQHFGVAVNILTVVSQANVRHAREVYQYLVKRGFYYHQYIPCLELDPKGNPFPYSISGPEWGRFLLEVFDAWYPNDIHKVSVRHFDDILNKRYDGSITACSLSNNCCQYFLVEHNGDIFPCDFFVRQDLKIGNIMDTSWEEALSSSIFQDFGCQKSVVATECKSCVYLDLCQGDCLKHRGYLVKTGGVSHFCEGWLNFYHHTSSTFNKLIEEIRSG
ncbi:MAG: anaerobic sulfatase maturase [Deltaproteobacteria bacterium]|nr:anaerobic sulfatase maturase [Deltaproteobacteria bacterium]